VTRAEIQLTNDGIMFARAFGAHRPIPLPSELHWRAALAALLIGARQIAPAAFDAFVGTRSPFRIETSGR
jgi:hypothetical protein